MAPVIEIDRRFPMNKTLTLAASNMGSNLEAAVTVEVKVCGQESIQVDTDHSVFQIVPEQDESLSEWLDFDLTEVFTSSDQNDCPISQYLICEDSECATLINDPSRFII